jgi:hypothetical protein
MFVNPEDLKVSNIILVGYEVDKIVEYLLVLAADDISEG